MIIGIYKGTFAPFNYGNLQVIQIISQFIAKKENDDFEIWIQLEKQEKVEEKFNQLYTPEEMKPRPAENSSLNYLSPETFNWTRRLLTVIHMINFYSKTEQIRIIEQPMDSIELIKEAMNKTNRPIYWISSSKINESNDLEDADYQAIKELYSQEKIVGISVENLFQKDLPKTDSIRRDLEYISLKGDTNSTVMGRISRGFHFKEVFDFLTCRISVVASLNNQQGDYFINSLQENTNGTAIVLHLKDYYYPDQYHHMTNILDNQNNLLHDYRHPETVDQTKLFNDILLLSSKYNSIVVEGSQAFEIPALLDLAIAVHLIENNPIKAKYDLWKSRKHTQNQEEWTRFSKYWDNYVLPRLAKTHNIYCSIPQHKKLV